jgi:hypothetical protein
VQNRDGLHLKGEVSGQHLSPLIGGALKADAMYPVDLWIDEPTSNPLQLHVAEPDGSGWLIELAGFNEPLEIPTPTVPPPVARPQA